MVGHVASVVRSTFLSSRLARSRMKIFAYSPPRPPTRYEMMSLVSISSAVQVQTSPASGGGAFASSRCA